MKTGNKLFSGKNLTGTLLIAFAINCISFGQNENPNFINLSLEDGVPLNQTYTIIQDHQGYLWMGTMYGLIRYDGRDYKIYNYDSENPESISFNDVVSIYEDSKDNLWIGTWGGGLNMLNKERTGFKRFLSDPSNKDGIKDNIIWQITEDKNGNIWMETGSGGINKYNPVTNKFSVYHLDNSDSFTKQIHINDLLVDSEGILWAGSALGLSKFSDSANAFITYPVVLADGSLVKSSVYKIYENSKKKLLLGISGSLIYFDKINKNFKVEKSFPGKRILSISEDHNGMMWLGTTNGLIKYNPVNSTFSTYTHSDKRNSICGNFIKNVFEDKSGVLWANCYNSGISKMTNRKSKFGLLQSKKNDQNSLTDNQVSSVTEDKDGIIWIGTVKGLNKYNPATGITERIMSPLLLNKHINAITVSSDNSLFIAIGSKLLTYNPRKKIVKEFIPEQQNKLSGQIINNLFVDTKENLWIGTYSTGIYLLNDGELKHFSLVEKNSLNNSADYILSLHEDHSGKIWIGTYGGLFSFNGNNYAFNSFKQELNNPKTLSNNYVFCMAEDLENRMWIGTASGLNLFDQKSGSFKSYFIKDGLPSDVICGLEEDANGNLWISTQNGISRFDPGTKTFTNFNKDDGLQSNLFSEGVYLKATNGEIYLGGRNGLNYFDPSAVRLNKYNSTVIISSVNLIGGKNGTQFIPAENNSLELDYDQNSILIKLVSFDYANSERINFKYKLKGYSDKWVNLKNENNFRLQNLPPGNYLLTVMGTNSDGVWSSKKANLSLIINPPFWETKWFYSLILLVIISVSFFIHRLIVRSKIKRALRIEKIKEEEVEKIRKKTAIDFHDELGHRLTRISMMTELIKLKIGNSFADINSMLDQISENSKQVYNGAKDFIWSIDPTQDSFYELMIRLKDFGDDLFGNTNVRFEVAGLDESLQNTLLNMDWKKHLTLIIKEGMNNSLKHSNGNKVLLSTHIEGDEVEVKLVDNGEGFTDDLNKKGFGLKNMKTRAEKLNASLFIITKPGEGTKILIKGKFPVKSLNYA